MFAQNSVWWGTWDFLPQNYQLYPRTIASNQGTVRFKGTFSSYQSSANIQVFKDVNNDGDYNDAGETLPQINLPAGTSFDYSYQIDAGIFNYYFIFRNSSGTWLWLADKVVAGDAYYIAGQSNAEAKPVISADNDLANLEAGAARNFVRVYGGGSSTPIWGIGDGNKNYDQEQNTGQFGMRIGSRIVAEKGIPVCIMNGAELGHQIAYFQKNYPVDPNPTKLDFYGNTVANPNYLTNNYGRELTRLTKAGLQNGIRAVIWFQGESNTYTFPTENLKLNTADYITAFNTLYNSWDADLGLADRFYMIQIKPGCDGTVDATSDIQEAERQLDDGNNRMEIVSTNNLRQYNDNCHYRYNMGYREIGDRVLTIIYNDFYGVPIAGNSVAPEPLSAEFTATQGGYPSTIANEITMYFKRPSDDLAVINGSGPSSDDISSLIKLKGGTYAITSAKIVNLAIPPAKNFALRINFTQNGSQPNPTGLGFLSPLSGSAAGIPAITAGGTSGIGLINFNNFPIGFGILPADPLNLRINSSGSANNLQWEVEDNDRFESFVVERGLSSSSFNAIFTTAGTRQTGTRNYSYTDSKPNTDRNYYRIKAIKRDGKFLYSQVVAVNNKTSTAVGVQVYPNPVTDRANLSVSVKTAGPASLQIFDGAGKMISTRKINLQKGTNMFSAGEILDHGSGIYNIRVVTGDDVFNTRVVRIK